MDIAALSMAMSQVSVQQSASIAVTKLVMNSNSEIANQMISNMAVDTTKGQTIDITV